MNGFSITPFRGLHLLLLLLTATAVLLIFLRLRGKPEARRSRLLIGVCFFHLALFAGYKLSLSMDAAYIRAYYPNGFRIFNELPLHLCPVPCSMLLLLRRLKNSGTESLLCAAVCFIHCINPLHAICSFALSE